MAMPLALVFDLIGRDQASPAFNKVAGSADRAAVATERATKGLEASSARMSAAGARMTKGITLPLVGIAAVGVDMAAKFQQSTNVLVTAAGESVKNLGMIRKGILDISTSTGTSWKAVTDGMYQLEKAGYRGADALKVEKAAAQGAREEGASLTTVTAAMTSMMASYHLPASKAVMVMNEMKTAAGESKTTMEQFAGSLSTVLPLASANRISFADIAGSLASLTQHGTSADEAAQELAFTMRGLAAPNQVAIKEMAQLGINSVDVAKKLGDGPGGRGLAGTLNYLSETVLKRMGKSGTVLLSTFNASKVAAHDAQVEFSALAPATQSVASEFLKGQITAKGWTAAVKGMTPEQANLARQWATTQNSAHGFQQALRSGVSGTQTYSDALKKMTGGANGLNTVLQLTGASTAGTTDRIKKIAEAANGAGKNVSGWASTQKLFAVQLDMFKQTLAKISIEIGSVLIPALTSIVGWVSKLFGWVDNLSSGWKKAIGIVALFAAALGPILWIGGKVVTLFSLLGRGVAILATPFTRLTATIAETGATMGGLAARTSESEAVMTRAVVAGSAEQQAALERLIVTQRAAAESSMVGGAGAVGRGGRLGGIGSRMSMGGMMAGTGLAIGGTALANGARAGSGRSQAGGVLKDAGYGAMIGSFGGPLGTIAGGALGAVYGAFSNRTKGDLSTKTIDKMISDVKSKVGSMGSVIKSSLAVASQAENVFTAATVASSVAAGNQARRMVDVMTAQSGLTKAVAKGGFTQKDLTTAITGTTAQYNRTYSALVRTGSASGANLAQLSHLRLAYIDSAKALVSASTQSSLFGSKLRSLSAAIAVNGKTLDQNTYFGKANIQAIRSAAITAENHARAVFAQTGSLSKANGVLHSNISSLEGAARAAGLNKVQVDNLVRATLGIKNKTANAKVNTYGIPALQQAAQLSNSLQSKTVTFNLKTFGGSTLAAAVAAAGVGHNAAGTDFWRGGPTWVGEKGPELVNLPRGSKVVPNDVATRMHGSSSVGGYGHDAGQIAKLQRTLESLPAAMADAVATGMSGGGRRAGLHGRTIPAGGRL